MAVSPEKKKRPMSRDVAKSKAKAAEKAVDALKERRSPKAAPATEAKGLPQPPAGKSEKVKMSKDVAKGKAKSANNAIDRLKARRAADGKPGKGKVTYKIQPSKSAEKPTSAKEVRAKATGGKVPYKINVDPNKAPEKGPLRAPKGGPGGLDSGGGSRAARAFSEGMARTSAPGSLGARAMRGMTGNKGAALVAGASILSMIAPSLYKDATEAEQHYQERQSERKASGQSFQGRFKDAYNQEHPQRRATDRPDPGIDPTVRPSAPAQSEITNSLPSAQSVRDGVTKSSPATSPAGGVQTKGGLYPIYGKGTEDAKSFRAKFAEERGKGSKDFTWQDRKYNTRTKEDK